MRPEGDIPIGELSRRTGCNIETIRYYERIGLLPAPRRSGGRYRVYGADDVTRLAFVRRARELGFTLDAVRALLALAAGGGGVCAEVRGLAAAHLADVRARIADLRALERTLADAVRRCDGSESPNCPLIDALSGSPPPRERSPVAGREDAVPGREGRGALRRAHGASGGRRATAATAAAVVRSRAAPPRGG